MTCHRPYDDALGDFERIATFLVRDCQDREGRAPWSLGRFADWKYNRVSPRKKDPAFLSATAHLWLDDRDGILGVVINEDVASTLTLLPRLDQPHLVDEMLAWATEAWRPLAEPLPTGHGGLFCQAAPFQEPEIRALKDQGWKDQGPTDLCRRYALEVRAREPLVLDEDLRLVSMAECPDFASKKRLYQSVWHRGEPLTEEDLVQYEQSRQAPTYDPTLDFSVVTPGGDHIAGCTAFVDPWNRCAEIERVATHPDHRRQGLAEAVLRHCFRELLARGISTAWITGALGAPAALYGKLGAEEEWPIHTWTRQVPLASENPPR